MKRNYKSLAEYLRMFSPDTRRIAYELLKRAAECGFTDSPNHKRLEEEVAKIEKEKGKW